MTDIKLPAILSNTLPTLDALTSSIGVPRDILASQDEIEGAWQNLPRVLQKIPPELRTAPLGRMCIAIAVGLFDSAINYIWNLSIVELRDKVRRFGLNVVSQVTSKRDFDEQTLVEMKDAELLLLCLKLNLITEDGYFFLDQCRDIRNNFSAAHPGVGNIDDHEFVSYANRCAKYALNNEINPVGVDLSAFITAIKASKFTDEQASQWIKRISGTHEAQQNLIFGSLHGIYCDPKSQEEARVNALGISAHFAPSFTPKAKSDLVNRHHNYIADGVVDRHTASKQFFEKLGMLALLGEHEVHAVISNAVQRLLQAHLGMNNFYNEPPFSERLLELSSQVAIPESVKQEFVEVVVTCATGNTYGVCRAAVPDYHKMVKGFSPSEIDIMLALPNTKSTLARRIESSLSCKRRFQELVKLLDASSVSSSNLGAYNSWLTVDLT
ncbi:hypothetical protein V9K92_06300 [Phyllobacterium sp. CCNWLW109]|uniref:hypothetical protein n=1 Tax=Phyllobacterium sp. CCNWLW109 TaxID=3127479 RepID=UPI0030788809